MAEKVLDIILFGASGYTGKYCIKEMNRLIGLNGRSLTWGIAGRSEAKLRTVLHECKKETGADLSKTPVIIADVEDYASLKLMTAGARLLVNCCGPYGLYGEPVVKACIETRTHHLDISGEPLFMEYIQLNYHKAAQQKGVYIISACGFDCIPSDLGVILLQKQFKGVLNSVEVYMHTTREGKKLGPSLNYATWMSLVNSFARRNELSKIRCKLFSKPLPRFMPRLKPKLSIEKNDMGKGWLVPFFGADRSVIYRTQRYLHEYQNMRPVQVKTYEVVDSLYAIVGMGIFGFIFRFLVKYKIGRHLLLGNPVLFSAGMFSHGSPSSEEMDATRFSLTLKGNGWDKEIGGSTLDSFESPNKTLIACIGGYNAAYNNTATMVTLAAITVLTEFDSLPKGGGAYTPGAAFANTSLIEHMKSNGLVYKIKSKL